MKHRKITLFTENVIDSAHQLINYNGNCSNIHGHSWLLQLWIQGFLRDRDRVGIIFDFKKIKKITDKFDHKLLNDVEPFNVINPTAENIVNYIYTELKRSDPNLNFKVRLYETTVLKNTYAEIGDF